MASKRTPISKLDSALNAILEEYKTEVDKDLDTAIKKVAQAGQKALKGNSRSTFGGTGRYASGWSVATEDDRVLHRKSTLYNKTPGLPHLLEHGHAKRGGGRWTPDKQHIAPVEEMVIEQFEKEVLNL